MSSQAEPLTGPVAQEKEIFTVKEIAVYLSVSDSKIRQLIRRGAIPHVKIDGQYRFFLPAIREWLRGITVPVIRVPAVEQSDDVRSITNRIWNSTAEG